MLSYSYNFLILLISCFHLHMTVSHVLQFGDRGEELGMAANNLAQYYLNADTGKIVGPTDELSRTHRSLWKKLFKNTNWENLFEDEGCTNCCNYNNNNNNYGNNVAPQPLVPKPWQPLAPLFGTWTPAPLWGCAGNNGAPNYGPTQQGTDGYEQGNAGVYNSNGNGYQGPAPGSGYNADGNSYQTPPQGGGYQAPAPSGYNGTPPPSGGYQAPAPSGYNTPPSGGVDSYQAPAPTGGDYQAPAPADSGYQVPAADVYNGPGDGDAGYNASPPAPSVNNYESAAPPANNYEAPATAPASSNYETPTQNSYADNSGGYSKPVSSASPQIVYQPIIYVSPQYQAPTSKSTGDTYETSKDNSYSNTAETSYVKPAQEYESPAAAPAYGAPAEEVYKKSEQPANEYSAPQAPAPSYESNGVGYGGQQEHHYHHHHHAPQPAPCSSCGGYVPIMSVPIYNYSPHVVPVHTPCQSNHIHGHGYSHAAPPSSYSHVSRPVSSYGINNNALYSPNYGPPASSYVSLANPVDTEFAKRSLSIGSNSDSATSSTTYNESPNAIVSSSSKSTPISAYEEDAPSLSAPKTQPGVTKISAVYTVIAPSSASTAYSAPQQLEYVPPAPAPVAYQAPAIVPLRSSAVRSCGILTHADQPYRTCPELFSEYQYQLNLAKHVAKGY